MTDTPKVSEQMPELMRLTRKLRNDIRSMVEMHVMRAVDHELPRMGKTQTAHRLAAALVLTSSGLGTVAQMLTVTLAAVLNRPVNAAQALAYMMLNDGTTPLQDVLKRGDEMIALAKEHGFAVLDKGEFDPVESMRMGIQQTVDSDPNVRRMIRELADTDPTLGELLRKSGVDVSEKTKQ